MKNIFYLILVLAFFSCKKETKSIVSGQVTDKVTGEPVSGVTINVRQYYIESGSDDLSSDIVGTAITDNSGNYTINYNYKEGKPKGCDYQGCTIEVSYFYFYNNLTYHYYDSDGTSLQKKQDVEDFKLY